jgi:hypothetical protein
LALEDGQRLQVGVAGGVDVGAVEIGHGAVDYGVAADLAVQVENRRTS